MLRKIYEELVAIRTELQLIRNSSKMEPGFNSVSLYADNELYLTEIRICVSGHDLYSLQKEPFFQELVEYVEAMEKQTQENK